ncbi:2'-5' RNA ligase family protein [Brevibacillus panacihumi]|uniref:2'-5' RNA ligase family protein n=1 Tax=Brevibacillus panacihumi TaxID=497735 RepID=A0A3M8C1S2_9BACL|nr:2'-5' RNA ligase family protein [Brevibacillus panacihumi]RNB69628.1 2'-5' RNA ligase family protein [Brevibacillus panacihumi]
MEITFWHAGNKGKRGVTLERAIHIFPDIEQVELIQSIRKKYDPLYTFIPPHITLVFPFESEITNTDLYRHVKQAITGFQPFTIRLEEITASNGHYLFLNVKQGNDQIIALHDKLYTGPMAIYRSYMHTYLPHLTVGRLNHEHDLKEALKDTRSFKHRFETRVSHVIAERIDHNSLSKIEFAVSFPD